MRIAIDAMGGDRAPEEIVKGVVEYAAANSDVECILTGDKTRVDLELKKAAARPSNISIHHSSEIVEMHEHPVEALRKKKDSSILNAINLVRDGKADAVISAGNTGAAVAAGTFYLGLLEGVKRAGIAIAIPTDKGNCVIIDVGANINCKPINLLQYAVMASQYSKHIFNSVDNPAVGLLNIGEESTKGTELSTQTYQGLKKSAINFVGNVEGHDIFSGKCQVVVCDGFIGNTILKVIEGFSSFMFGQLAKKAGGSPEGMQSLKSLASVMDYSEYGGAPLLGIKGVEIICHGRSTAKAIRNAIRVAHDLVVKKVNDHIVEEIKRHTWLGKLHEWWKSS